MSKRLTAKFRPQANINGNAVSIDGGYEFDITDQIREMDKDDALALDENDEERDDLWRYSEKGNKDPHYGPFEVDIDMEAIASFFEDIETENMENMEKYIVTIHIATDIDPSTILDRAHEFGQYVVDMTSEPCILDEEKTQVSPVNETD